MTGIQASLAAMGTVLGVVFAVLAALLLLRRRSLRDVGQGLRAAGWGGTAGLIVFIAGMASAVGVRAALRAPNADYLRFLRSHTILLTMATGGVILLLGWMRAAVGPHGWRSIRTPADIPKRVKRGLFVGTLLVIAAIATVALALRGVVLL